MSQFFMGSEVATISMDKSSIKSSFGNVNENCNLL
jgi:hypothetical protein